MAARKKTRPFLLVYGDEDYLIDKVFETKRFLWKSKNRVVTYVDGSTTTSESLHTLCETPPLFESGSRIVVVDNAQELKLGKEFVTYLSGAFDSTSMSLVAFYRSDKLTGGWSEVAALAEKVEISKFKPWERDKTVQRITDEATDLGLKLADGVAHKLFAFHGDNLRAVVNELKKLQYLVQPKEVVSLRQVMLVASPAIPVEPYQVADAVMLRDAGKAMNLISRLYLHMGDSAWVPVVFSWMKQVERLLLAKHLLDRNDSISVIAARLGQKEYACKMNVIPLTSRHTQGVLVGQMKILCKLESQIKGSARSKRTLVELAVLSATA
jgi:DNA polymerase III delta subunit